MMDIQIKSLKENLYHVECLNDAAINIFNKIVFNINDTSSSAVVSAYCNATIIKKLKKAGLKIKTAFISEESKKIELEYYNRVRLG